VESVIREGLIQVNQTLRPSRPNLLMGDPFPLPRVNTWERPISATPKRSLYLKQFHYRGRDELVVSLSKEQV
jgi:hypothetical protein